MRGRRRFPLLLVLLALWWLLFTPGRNLSRTGDHTLPYSAFLDELEQGRVTSVVVREDRIEGTRWAPPFLLARGFRTTRIEDPTLIERLRSGGVRFDSVVGEGWIQETFSWVLPLLFMAGFWWWMLRGIGRGQTQMGTIGRAKARVYVERDLPVRFQDVAGVDEAKVELREVVEFLKDPVRYGRLGGRMPKGLLLVGPPGTGKTLLARAVAGEAEVPFFSINGSEFVELFVGLGAARVRDLFEQARKAAPCIIFIDEMDALGKARGLGIISGGANDEKEQTLNQLLAELDGFDPSGGIVLLAATNRPEILDPALLRSGRFDRQILIDMPDRKGREDILLIHLRKVNHSDQVEAKVLAGLTTGFSGADLANLVNEAALIATRRGANQVEPPDFTSAVERMVGGLERKSRVLVPEEKKRVAIHEMGHATVSFALDRGKAVHKVSIIPRGIGALGYTMRRPMEDRTLIAQSELEHQIAVLLGGRAAELLHFKDSSTGAADDLMKATEIARAMVERYGMGSDLGPASWVHDAAPPIPLREWNGTSIHSEEFRKRIDEETLRILEHAYGLAVRTLRHHERFVEVGVIGLLEKESLDESELNALWASHGEPESVTPQGLDRMKTGSTTRRPDPEGHPHEA
jgi:cell division protease FtsH